MKYTKEERLNIGRRIYDGKLSRYAVGTRMKILFKKHFLWVICGVIIISGLTLLIALYFNSSSVWFEGQGKNDAYEFPITPIKTPEKWKEFQTHQEMLDACQIPDEMLKNISTEGLIETCINYPMSLDFMLYDSFQMGFDTVYDNFNGLQELYQRQDCIEKLIDFFVSINLNKLKRIEKPTLIYRFSCMLISRDDVISKINDEQQDLLIDAVNIQIKIIEEKYKDFYSENAPLCLKFRILRKKHPEFHNLCQTNKILENFIETGNWGTITIADKDKLLMHINDTYN